MSIAKISFSYETSAAWKSLTLDQYEAIRKVVGTESMHKPEEGKEFAKPYGDFIVDLSELAPLCNDAGIHYEVKLLKGVYLKGESIGDHINNNTPTQAIYIKIPGVGMLSINEVYLLTNACTDELQTYLNDGWRMVAVCPANDQRRPDYILGRHNETKDKNAKW